MSKYYCLVASLPEIRHEEYKLQYNLEEFKDILIENLDKQDFELAMLFYLKFDNNNLLAFLEIPGFRVDPRGSISPEIYGEIVRQLNEQENIKDERYPEYFRKFISSFLNDEPIFPGLNWEDQLTALYFEAAIRCGNHFISEWFEFNLAVTNLFTAMNSRNYAIDVAGSVVGTNEVATTIRVSNAKDFGISPIFPYLQQVMHIADETDLLEREKKTDLLKWSWIEENVFHYNFSIENIFAYLLQTEIIERWIGLSPETGNKVFREFIDQLRGSFQFPEAYKLNK